MSLKTIKHIKIKTNIFSIHSHLAQTLQIINKNKLCLKSGWHDPAVTFFYTYVVTSGLVIHIRLKVRL